MELIWHETINELPKPEIEVLGKWYDGGYLVVQLDNEKPWWWENDGWWPLDRIVIWAYIDEQE